MTLLCGLWCDMITCGFNSKDTIYCTVLTSILFIFLKFSMFTGKMYNEVTIRSTIVYVRNAYSLSHWKDPSVFICLFHLILDNSTTVLPIAAIILFQDSCQTPFIGKVYCVVLFLFVLEFLYLFSRYYIYIFSVILKIFAPFFVLFFWSLICTLMC